MKQLSTDCSNDFESLDHLQNQYFSRFKDSSLAPKQEQTKNLDETWASCIELLGKDIKASSLQAWIKPSKLVSLSQDTAVLAVKNEFSRSFISQSYLKAISAALHDILGRNLAIRISVQPEALDPEPKLDCDTHQSSLAELNHPNENKKVFIKSNTGDSYTGLKKHLNFQTFYPFASNRASLKFAEAFASGEIDLYNSLFIHAESGLGKTHLLQAIGNLALSSKTKKLKVKYVKSEEFANELIFALRKGEVNKFKNTYRKLDLLLFDDIQFLMNKKVCQEEFFHTYDAIISAGGKVIISSAISLEGLEKISKKIKARLSASLVSSLAQPSLEDRVSLLEFKAQQLELKLSRKQATVIASKYQDNIFELEGALIKLKAYQDMDIAELDDDLVSKLFAVQLEPKANKGLSIQTIIEVVTKYFNLDKNDLVSKKRSQNIAKARHLAIYLANDLLDMSYQGIGEFFSRKHSSVIHSLKVITSSLASNLDEAQNLKLTIRDIKSKIME